LWLTMMRGASQWRFNTKVATIQILHDLLLPVSRLVRALFTPPFLFMQSKNMVMVSQ
jgi:hypothetical protein